MKKILTVVLAIALVFSFSACEKNEAKIALEQGLTAIKNYDKENMAIYLGEGLNEKALEVVGIEQAKAIFSTLSWKISYCSQDGNSALASVKISAVSMAEVLNKISTEILEKSAAGTFIEDLNGYALERFAEIAKKTETIEAIAPVDFVLEKVGDQWKIVNPEAILAVFNIGTNENPSEE